MYDLKGYNDCMKRAIVIFCLCLLIMPSMLNAVERAPKISDKEIIESLATLKEGQRALNQRIDQLEKSVNQRFDDVNQRIDDVNQDIDGLQNIILVLFSAIITLIIALFGYIIWDRRTALRPLQDRIERIEQEIYRDLELQNEDGSRLTRLVKALREMAKTDEKIADILRMFSLL